MKVTITLIISWTVGILISSLLGKIIIEKFMKILDNSIKKVSVQRKWAKSKFQGVTIPYFPSLIGIIERLFFTILLGLHFDVIASFAGPYLIVKMATGWNRITSTAPIDRAYSFRSLFGSLVSISIGILCGLLCKYNLSLKIYNLF